MTDVMVTRNTLFREIDSIPVECLSEVFDFMEFVKQKHQDVPTIPETMRLSETSLAKEWLSPEEDMAWETL